MNTRDNPAFDQSMLQNMPNAQNSFRQNPASSINDQDELMARRKFEHRRLFQQKQGKTATDVDSLMQTMFIDLSLKTKPSSSTVSDITVSISNKTDSGKVTQTAPSNPICTSGAADWSKIVFDDELQTVFRHEEAESKQASQPFEQNFTLGNSTMINTQNIYPSWCMKAIGSLPLVYQQVFEASYSNNIIQTSILYPILLLSGLRQEQLGQIWSQVNLTQPGILSKEELFMALALIALAQNSEGIIYSIEHLHHLSEVPIPNFQIQQVESQLCAIVPVAQTESTLVNFEQDDFGDFTNFTTNSDTEPVDMGSILDLDINHLCPPSSKAISSETQSITSLELPVISSIVNNCENTSEKENSETSSIFSQPNNESFHNISSSSANTNAPIQEQKLELTQFSFFTDEPSPIDLNLSVWTRCFEKCHSILSQANETFSSIQSPSICTEVLQETRGKAYAYNLQEIFHVHKRIYTAAVKDLTIRAQLTGIWKQIIVLWTNLQSFFSTTQIRLLNDDDVDYSALLSDVQESTHNYCSLCLLSTNGLETVLPSSLVDSFNRSCLTFAGRYYHAPCANFYLNLVDGILPNLQRNF